MLFLIDNLIRRETRGGEEEVSLPLFETEKKFFLLKFLPACIFLSFLYVHILRIRQVMI